MKVVGASAQPGEPQLVDFQYTVVPGGEYGKWLLMSPRAVVTDENNSISKATIQLFDDDGDGIMQPEESTGYGYGSVEIEHNSVIGFAPQRIRHETKNPWFYLLAETKLGRVERTWKFEPPP